MSLFHLSLELFCPSDQIRTSAAARISGSQLSTLQPSSNCFFLLPFPFILRGGVDPLCFQSIWVSTNDMLPVLVCLSWAAWEQVKMSGSLFMSMSKTTLIGCTQVVQLLSRWTQSRQDAAPQVSLWRPATCDDVPPVSPLLIMQS